MIDNPDLATTEETKPDAAAQARLQQRREEVEGSLSVVSTLSAKDRRFTAAFLMGDSLKDAYLYANPNYTGDNARKLGWQWRRKEKIQAAIDEYFHAQEMSAAEVIARLSDQAKALYGRYLRWDADRNEVYCDLASLLADGLGHLIKKVGYDRTGTDSAVQVVEFYDAHTALVDLGRFHSLFTDKADVNLATRDDGMTVEEWRDQAAQRRQQAAETAALFSGEDPDESEATDVDTED